MAIPINTILEEVGIPVAYGVFREKTPLPYIVWLGGGQEHFSADNTYYTREDNYQIELYFKLKDPVIEAQLEQILLDNGLHYEKSEDVYTDDEGVFLVYYNV